MKLSGSIKYQKTYLYTIYISPEEHRDEIVRIFGNRWNNGKKCFGMNEKDVEYSINRLSIYIVVHEKNTNDYASSYMTIEDRCFHKDKAQVWIWALCRHGEKSSVISPVKVMFDVIGEFVLQKLNKNYLYLFPEPGEGIEKLKSIYRNYGFVETYCPDAREYAMAKKLVPISKTRTHKRRTRRSN
jgi:hypothetical protein